MRRRECVLRHSDYLAERVSAWRRARLLFIFNKIALVFSAVCRVQIAHLLLTFRVLICIIIIDYFKIRYLKGIIR